MGFLKRAYLKNLDWEIQAFVSEAEDNDLIVFEIPKGNEHLIGKIEALIQKNELDRLLQIRKSCNMIEGNNNTL